MKYIDEYRDAVSAKKLANAITDITTKQWTIMEICGGQTHSIVKYGIDELLPKQITLVHGPGCPVCVTPIEIINKAIEIASRENVIFCSFGDMLRVPGTEKDLLSVKASGGDVRIVYSPMDAVKLAESNPDKEVVFFAVGFETTAPANAMAVYKAKELKLSNFSILVSHVLVPPAIEAILSAPNHIVQGFLAAGHVCTVMGYEEYFPISEKYKVPIVVTGFEPVDILHGIYMCIKQLENGRYEVENQYTRSVKKEGNTGAQSIIKKVFRVVHRKWRGVGEIPYSGLGLNDEYIDYDAERRFNLTEMTTEESKDCIAGEILQGFKKPFECTAFGNKCTPEFPIGAPMVSSEGACAAYYRYRKLEVRS
ncbi:MAG: hydrogenase formation protein HypD [Ignavibacteriae bacterium]|nr:MAG: hydrogenase formation protein HypD [Ignavibacteriota bacterium]